VLRAALWEKYDLLNLLACYGTAGGSFRHLARPEQAYWHLVLRPHNRHVGVSWQKHLLAATSWLAFGLASLP